MNSAPSSLAATVAAETKTARNHSRNGSGPAASISRRLMLVIAATTIPLTLLNAGILYADYRIERIAAEARLVGQAQTLSHLVDHEIERAQIMARALAVSTAFTRLDVAAIRQQLLEAIRTYAEELPASAQPVMIGMARLDGNWIADTGQQDGSLRRSGRVRDEIGRAIATGTPQVSDLFVGDITGQPRISIAVPVFSYPTEAGQPRRVIGAIGVAISRDRFLDIVRDAHVPPLALASIQDRRGVTIARSMRDAETVGRLPTPAVLDAILHNDSGLAPRGTKTLEGVVSTIAFAHAPKSGFIVKLDIPDTIFLTQLRNSLIWTACVGLFALLLGVALSLLMARPLVVALRRVLPAAQAAAHLGAAPEPLGLREADDVAGELTRLLIDQRAAAHALAESETKFRTMTDALPQLVWAADPNGVGDYYNARCYEFAGDKDPKCWWDRTHPDDRASLGAAWRRAIPAGEPFEVECRRQRHDGVYRSLLIRAMPFRADAQDGNAGKGPVLRWFGSSTDITDIAEACEVAARGRADLEALIDQRTRDLWDMQTRLVHAARMEALGQLAGGIAHDFNNVLQAVLGGSALIERKPNDPVLVVKHARLVFDSAERGATITRRLLSFSHRSALRAETIDTRDLLHDIQGILSHTLGAAIRTEIAARTDIARLFADKGQLETVLVNLATKARDAMGGKGTIVLGAADETVADTDQDHPASLAPGTYVCLSVADTGIGMDAATLQRVVELFFTTKGAGQGTGLGLAMAHGFAGQSGGGLHIVSAPGAGTTVKLWLPTATDMPRSPPDAPHPPATPDVHPARLLVVDDEALVREVVKETLELEGYQVVTAASGEQALAMLQTATIDLLLSDLAMPGMDGVTLIRAAQRRLPGLPAILVTGFARDETELAMTGAVSGSFSVLRKPVTSAQLCGRVADLLQTARTSA